MNEKLKIYEENGENQSQMNSSVTEKCFKSQRPEFIKGFDCLKSCFRCRARCNWRSQTAGNLLVGSGPKRSMLIEKLRSSSLVSSIFQREGRLHCSLTGRKLWSKVKKCSRHLIYARLNRIHIGQARALCHNVC